MGGFQRLWFFLKGHLLHGQSDTVDTVDISEAEFEGKDTDGKANKDLEDAT